MSLDSTPQPNAEPWDAFSNHTDAASEPNVGTEHAQSSPLSPQRQAAAAKAKAFIKSQTSNVQSMQVTCERRHIHTPSTCPLLRQQGRSLLCHAMYVCTFNSMMPQRGKLVGVVANWFGR